MGLGNVIVEITENPYMLHILCTGVIGHGLPQDGSSRRVSVLRTLRDFVLGQNLLPQGESSPCAETLSLGYFL